MENNGFLRRVRTCTVSFLQLFPFAQVKFVEQHGEVSDATAAFVRFAIAAGASLPFADFREKDVLFAGEKTDCLLQKIHFKTRLPAPAASGFVYWSTQEPSYDRTNVRVCLYLCVCVFRVPAPVFIVEKQLNLRRKPPPYLTSTYAETFSFLKHSGTVIVAAMHIVRRPAKNDPKKVHLNPSSFPSVCDVLIHIKTHRLGLKMDRANSALLRNRYKLKYCNVEEQIPRRWCKTEHA